MLAFLKSSGTVWDLFDIAHVILNPITFKAVRP